MKGRALQWMKRHRNSIVVGAALAVILATRPPFVDGAAVKQEFYAASAAAIPVLLLALLIRLSRLRDTILEMLDDASDKKFSAEIKDLEDSAEDAARRQELAKVATNRKQMANKLEDMVPGIFASLVGAYFLAVLGEGGSLFALGNGASMAWTFVAASISLIGIVAFLVHLELLDYRLQLADRGLLMTLRGIERVDLAEYARTES